MTGPSGGRQVWARGGVTALQGFQRTGRGADLAGGDTQISGRGAQAAMAEQQLDGAQIGAGLQQMDGERMAQGMRGDRLGDAGSLKRLPAGDLNGERRDRLPGPVAWKQPLLRMGVLPVVRRISNSLGESIT